MTRLDLCVTWRKIAVAASALVLLLLVFSWVWLRQDGAWAPRHNGHGVQAGGGSAVGQPSVGAGSASAVRGAMTASGVSITGSSAFKRHFELLKATPGETRLKFTAGRYSVSETKDSDGRVRSVVAMEDGWTSQNAGYPQVPVYRANIAVPKGKTQRIEVTNADWEEVVSAPPMASAGMLLRTEEQPKHVEEAAIYASQEVWPSETASVGTAYNVRHVMAAGVIVQPMAYDFSRGVLKICRGCEISVVSEDAVAEDYGQVSSNRDFAQIQTRGVLNETLLRPSSSDCVGRGAIVVPDDWKADETLQALVAWRESQGYEIKLLGYPTDTNTGTKTDKAGLAEKIKELYADWSLTHLMLVGGVSNVPPMVLYSDASRRNTPGFILACSDVDYALLEGDDCHQDIFLSRLAVVDASEMSAVIRQLLAYEQAEYDASVDDSWRSSCEYIGGNDITLNRINAPPEFGALSYDYLVVDNERQRMEAAGVVTVSRCRYPTDNPAPTAALVKSDLDLGASLVVYMGHGNNTYWKTSKFSVTQALTLTNGGMRPFVSSCVCLTGNFGYTLGKCLAAALLTATEGGACGMLASTNDTYIYPPMYIMKRLDDEVIATESETALYSQGAFSLAAIMEGVEYCETTTYENSGRQELTAKQMHLIGDCMMAGRFRQLKKSNLSVARDATGGQLVVQVTRGDAAACGVPVKVVFKSTGDAHQGWTDSTGTLTLALDEKTKSSALTVNAYDPSCGLLLQEVGPVEVQLDANGDGFISNSELLTYLCFYKDDAMRSKAIATWTASGASARVVTSSSRSDSNTQAVTGSRSVVPAVNGDPTLTENDAFDCRRNPNGKEIGVPEGRDANGYNTYDELAERIKTLCVTWPDICQYELVGESHQGRRIHGVRIGRPSEEIVPVELLIAGGIHGNERSTVEVSMRYAEWMMANQEDAGVKALLENAYLYVIPSLNPDGMAAVTRYNSNGIDLNRSFPDGVINSQLGMYGAGDSLWLDESLEYEESGRQWDTSLIKETAEFMRWCCARRLNAALMVHSGDRCVAYPYGNNENFQQTLTPTPDHDLILTLAQTYAGKCTTSWFKVINSAEWYPVIGEAPDWMYRYLGCLPLTVEICYPKEPSFATMDSVFLQHRDAMSAWAAAVIQGIGGTVKTPDGAPVAYTKVTVNDGTPVYTDRKGRFFRSTLGESSVELEASGYAKKTVTAGMTNQLAETMDADSDVTVSWKLPQMRFRPLYNESLQLQVTDHRDAPGECVVTVDTIASRTPELASNSGKGLLGWRWEPTGGMSVLVTCSECDSTIDLAVIWDEKLNDDHKVTWQWQTANGSGNRAFQWLPATKVAFVQTPETSMFSLEGYPIGTMPEVFQWNGTCFELTSQLGPFAGYWGENAVIPTTGWYRNDREVELKAGWNFVGVTSPMAASRFLIALQAEGDVYITANLLMPGKAYWVYCEKTMTLGQE